MKKFLAIVALAVVFTACNNESETTDAAQKAADSTRVADSIKAEEAKAAAVSDSTGVATDSTAKTDSLKK